MEEKERYSWYNHSAEEIYDNKENIVFVGTITVLNQQNRRIWELIEENKQLKQQLAEKEKEIESLRENSLSKRIFKEKLIPSHCMEQYEKYEQQIDKLTQDKISCCIEQLEKVKEFFLEEHRDEEMDTDYIITKDAGEIADYLLDQIKQLKEVK